MVKLLTKNYKLAKGEETGWIATGLSLLPGNKSGKEYCPNRGACFATCLDTAGRGLLPIVEYARTQRSKLWNDAPHIFAPQLHHELHLFTELAKQRGMKPACRLNVMSDIPWERKVPGIFKAHPFIQFYDYTKNPDRARRSLKDKDWPKNYDLTFSWNEKANASMGRAFLKRGGRIAVVSRQHGPDTPVWMQVAEHVVDGDEHDLTFLHPKGSVLLLTPKGRLRKARTRFA